MLNMTNIVPKNYNKLFTLKIILDINYGTIYINDKVNDIKSIEYLRHKECQVSPASSV